MNGAAGKDRPSPAPRPPGVPEAGPCAAARASAGGPEPAKDPLASLEGRIVLETLLERFSSMRLLSERPAFRNSVVLRGLRFLPVADVPA